MHACTQRQQPVSCRVQFEAQWAHAQARASLDAPPTSWAEEFLQYDEADAVEASEADKVGSSDACMLELSVWQAELRDVAQRLLDQTTDPKVRQCMHMQFRHQTSKR